jgi:glutaredoxin
MATWRRYLALAVAGLALGAAADARAMTLQGFGRCLKGKGATFYGASWCPHCRAQRETLGEAMEYVRYVECSVDGDPHETTPACRAAKIEGYPTWTFADGSRVDGEQSLERLAAKTGCALPKPGP